MFKIMNVGTRVVVFEGTYAEFQAMQIDNTDRRALVGAREDANTFLEDNRAGMDFPGNCTPHNSDALDLSPGVIAVSTWCHDKYRPNLKASSDEQTSAYGIVHGTSHTTGAAHCGDNQVCNPDVAANGEEDIHSQNYAASGNAVIGLIQKHGYTMQALMTPGHCPLTILAHINKFEPKRYLAIQNTAYKTAQKIVDSRLAQFGNVVKFSPEALQRAYQRCADELMQNGAFVTNAINSTPVSPSKPSPQN